MLAMPQVSAMPAGLKPGPRIMMLTSRDSYEVRCGTQHLLAAFAWLLPTNGMCSAGAAHPGTISSFFARFEPIATAPSRCRLQDVMSPVCCDPDPALVLTESRARADIVGPFPRGGIYTGLGPHPACPCAHHQSPPPRQQA